MIKILIAEDDPHMQKLLQLFLQNYQADLDFVGNGRIAEKRFLEKSYDLLITDLQMPEVDGTTLIQNIRKRDNLIPVIILSSYDKVEIEKLINYPYIDSLRKPFESIDLIKMINHLISKPDHN